MIAVYLKLYGDHFIRSSWVEDKIKEEHLPELKAMMEEPELQEVCEVCHKTQYESCRRDDCRRGT